MTGWISEDDWTSLARVALGPECCPEPDEGTLAEPQLISARDAVAGATAILQAMTGSRVHGPGIAVDEFHAWPTAKRLKLTQQPVRKLIEILRVTATETSVLDGQENAHLLFSGAVHFSQTRNTTYRDWECRMGFYPRYRSYVPNDTLLRVQYLYGSTVSPAAKNALLTLARELFLAGPCGDTSECSLPERVISLTREGMSYTLLDPQNFYEKGRLGVPVVDQWLASLKLSGNRAAGLFGPDSPPGVNLSLAPRPASII